MIYGRREATITDPENGRVHLTASHPTVTIKQNGDLIRLAPYLARELALDILSCLGELDADARAIAKAPKARGTARNINHSDLTVMFDRPLTDDEFRAFDEFVKGWVA